MPQPRKPPHQPPPEAQRQHQHPHQHPQGPDGLRRRNKEDKLQRIRDAAWHLFTTQGYDATTTRAVAERAQIGTGTLFLYARSKSDLLFLVFRDQLERLVDKGFATLPREGPLLDALVHLFAGFYSCYAEVPDLGRRFVRELLSLNPEQQRAYDDLNQRFFGALSDLLVAAQRRGEARPDLQAPLFAVSLFAIYGFHVLTWLGEDPPRASSGVAGLRLLFAEALRGV